MGSRGRAPLIGHSRRRPRGRQDALAAASVLVNAMQSEPSAKDQGRPGFGSNGFVAQNTF
jgi:hypothetical protein